MMNDIQPLPWKWDADKERDRLQLVSASEYAALNDPVVLTVREDWVGYLLNSPQGKAHMNLILEGVNNHEKFRRLLLKAVVMLEYAEKGGQWDDRGKWVEDTRAALKMDVCGL